MALINYVPLVGLLGFGAALGTYFYAKSLPAGAQNAQDIAAEVQDGAFVFLKREYSIIAIFIVVVFFALFFGVKAQTAYAYLLGALLSMTAGFVGMCAATSASSRTLEAAKTGGAPLALDVAFKGGSVMGITVSAFGVLGVSAVFLIWREPEIVNGFAMGASSIALFARIGGGIYTKAADVGADIVGKTEANIPEDDPRNPGVIADNVGDNVGDTAGMGADLFESYVGSIIACLALAYAWQFDPDPNVQALSYLGMKVPLYLAAAGLVCSLLGVVSMRFLRSMEPDKALHGATYISGLLFAAITFYVIRKLFGNLDYFYCVIAGLITGILIGEETNYYTSGPPIKKQAISAQSGSATGIINGIAYGFESVIMPIVTIVIGIGVAFKFGGLYGIAMAAFGMLATIGIVMATDSYGPIADNAGGLAEMSGAGPEIRKITDKLDALGNSTAAVGKGFAIGSAALTALALFSAFQKTAAAGGQTLLIQLTDVKVVMGLFLGVMMPCAIAAMTMKAVGRAAMKMVIEIRRQFKEIDGLLEGKAKPDTGTCIDIVTKGSLGEMILPGISAVVAPLLVGYFLGLNALGGFLAGATACGVVLGLMMANAGAIWDNAKKHIEEGNFGGKGSDTHKAAVVGDTVGDPFKDTSGPAMNILIKLMTIVSLVFLPFLMKFQ